MRLRFRETNFLKSYCMHTDWTRIGSGRVRDAIFKTRFPETKAN